VSGVPGRLERVGGAATPEVVDYAHTPAALERSLAAVREHARGRVLVVFGCGGDRDRTKRPVMGRIAAERADRAWVTNDNPRGEDPRAIADEIVAGAPVGRLEVVLDRREAIAAAIAGARRGDLVLIAGKGHETTQTVGDRVLLSMMARWRTARGGARRCSRSRPGRAHAPRLAQPQRRSRRPRCRAMPASAGAFRWRLRRLSIDTRTLAGQPVRAAAGSRDGHEFPRSLRARWPAVVARSHHAATRVASPGQGAVDDTTAALRSGGRFREGRAAARRHRQCGQDHDEGSGRRHTATGADTSRPGTNNHGRAADADEPGPDTVAVLEMGMNQPGEIAQLAAIAAPNGAVITNAGVAHLERMGTREAIAREKASLALALSPRDVVFAGADSPALIAALEPARCRKITYGLARTADVRPSLVTPLGADGSRIEVDGFPPLVLHLIGRHQVANALAAFAVAREYGLDPKRVVDALEAYRPAHGRMEVRHVRGATLLVDCYNANPDSTRAALETLAEFPDARRRIAILGDMLELGPEAPRLHRETADAVRNAELWAVGTFADDWAAGARHALGEPRVMADVAAARTALDQALGDGVVVLLKASRGAALERVLEGLERE
jgi:murE/murF fusion protein